MNVRGQQAVRIFRDPPVAGYDFIPLKAAVGIIVIGRGIGNSIYQSLPAIPGRTVVHVPVAIQPAHGQPVLIPLTQPKNRCLRDIWRTHTDLPDTPVIRTEAFNRHLPCGPVAVDVERELAKPICRRGLAAIRSVSRIRPLRHLRSVVRSVAIRIRNVRIAIIQVLAKICQSVGIRIIIRPLLTRRQQRVEPMRHLPSVRHAVAVAVRAARIRRQKVLVTVRQSVSVRVALQGIASK